MSIRVHCPSCESPNSVNDDMRGTKVRCRQCKAPFTVPAAKKKASAEDALQEGRKLKTQAAGARPETDDDEEADERPIKKAPAKKGSPVLMLVGCAAALFLVLSVAAAGIAGIWWLKSRTIAPDVQMNAPMAQAELKEEKKPDEKIELKNEAPAKGPEKVPPLLDNVARATVYIAALTLDGRTLEGSGFFTVEPGLIITNAHVLGMLDAKAPPPSRVEAIVNGGDVSETKLRCTILAVDRDNDLAALRVTSANLPAPLNFEEASKVDVAQKVHIAGYPMGRQERKDVTLTGTEIAKLKKNPGAGTLEEVQVNGGMKPGSSGGPVVTPSGMVVGVALGAIRDTSMHLAIPGDVVNRFLAGRIGAGSFDKPFQFGKDTKVPVTYPLIDPLRKIKDVKVEVWAGPPGEPRPASSKPPVPVPGDGQRRAQPLTNQNPYATNDVTLPANVPAGQVIWMQPLIVLADNSMQWGVATSMPVPTVSPYDRKPASLIVKLQTPKERTVKLKYTRVKTGPDGTKTSIVDTTILEVMGVDPDGASMKTGFGPLNIFLDDARTMPLDKPTLDLVRQIPTAYVVDNTNRVTKRSYRTPDPKAAKETRDAAQVQQYHVGMAYEAGIVPMLNRSVQPGENWKINVPVMISSKLKTAEAVLVLDSTYQGFQQRANVNEAIITVTGKLQPQGPGFNDVAADVTGTIGFNEAAGFISSTQLKFTNSAKNGYTLDIDLTRSAGNPGKIQLPQDPKPSDPPIVAKMKVVLDKKEVLTAKDLADPAFSDVKKKKLAHYKEFMVQMDMGKTYAIEVKTTAFEPYIKLMAPGGMLVDGKAGRVQYRAAAAGQYRVYVIGHNHKTGAFQVTVTENP